MTPETALKFFAQPTADQTARIEWIRYYALCLATVIVSHAPDNAERGFALTQLRDVVNFSAASMLAETDEAKLDEIQANAFTDFFTRTIPRLFGKTFTADQTKALAVGIASFVKTDVGRLAIDAVEYVDAHLPSSSAGTTEAEKDALRLARLNAAKTKIKADAVQAKVDLTGLGTSFLNYAVETALQYVVTKGLTLALGAVAKVA